MKIQSGSKLTKVLYTRISEELYNQLVHLAYSNNLSITALVNQLLEQSINELE